MVRFQLVFQTADGERSEIRDNNTAGEPHIDGKVIVDGGTYTVRNVEWIFRREDVGGMTRFVLHTGRRPGIIHR